MSSVLALPTTSLSRERFAAWLREKRPHEVVGRARLAECCPLATWSGLNICTEGAAVGEARPWQLVGALPEWAERFRLAVDAQRHATPITAGEALAMLGESTDVVREDETMTPERYQQECEAWLERESREKENGGGRSGRWLLRARRGERWQVRSRARRSRGHTRR